MVRSHPARPGGFTFVELVVALLIVGIALIGIAALYAESTRATLVTEPRARAQALAEQIAARIRENPAGRSGYASVVGVVCDPAAKPRRVTDAAALEAACWQQRVARELPSGHGAITRDASTHPPTYVIAVSWSPREGGAASFVMRVQARDTE